MRVTLSDARESPVLALVFVLGAAVAAFALLYGDGEFGAPTGSPLWIVGVAAAVVAIGVTILARRSS